MSALVQTYTVDASDFSGAGEASGNVKKTLKTLGFAPDIIRRVSIAMYEAEINMVIHANGGTITVTMQGDKLLVHCLDEDFAEGLAGSAQETRLMKLEGGPKAQGTDKRGGRKHG